MEKYMLNILASLGKRSQLIESCNYFHLKGHFIYTSYLFFFFFWLHKLSFNKANLLGKSHRMYSNKFLEF